MLSAEQNDLLCRVEGDAPMGALMKRYWLPACASDAVTPGGAPVRSRVLGTDTVIFRRPDGRPGAVYEYCSHRGASLALARNEACGLRCLYHGWQVDIDGRIVDMPTEPPGSRTKDLLRHQAYPVVESGGLIWLYLGPGEAAPPFDAMPWATLPAQRTVVCKLEIAANWAQAFEGQLDSAHSSTLHSTEIRTSGGPLSDVEVARAVDVRPSGDPNPRLATKRAPYGMRYAAIRQPTVDADTHDYVRITVFVAPCFALIPASNGSTLCTITVPRDDYATALYVVHFSATEDLDRARFQAILGARPGIDFDPVSGRNTRHRANNFLQDRGAMARGNFSGIEGIGPQDLAMWESMGRTPIIDRTREHLGRTDVAVAQFRRIMIDAAERFRRTGLVLGRDTPAIPLSRLRAFEGTVPKSANWEVLGLCDEERALLSESTAAD
jgi:phthalate 4,5-dioxygenase